MFGPTFINKNEMVTWRVRYETELQSCHSLCFGLHLSSVFKSLKKSWSLTQLLHFEGWIFLRLQIRTGTNVFSWIRWTIHREWLGLPGPTEQSLSSFFPEDRGRSGWSGHRGYRKNLSPMPGIETRSPGRPARILIELPGSWV